MQKFDTLEENLKSICKIYKSHVTLGFTSNEIQSTDGDSFPLIMNKLIHQKLIRQYESKCIGHGYILPNSVKLLSRSAITFPPEALQLIYSVRVEFEYIICNPNPDSIIECSIVSRNKIGILARMKEAKSPLVILIPYDLCETQEKHTQLRIKDTIRVKIVGKKFEQNDKKIIVIAEIIQ